jgi:HSP20 family protein
MSLDLGGLSMPIMNHRPDFQDELPAGLRLFQDSVARILSESGGRPWTPSVDVLENENDLVLKADVPGINLKDIDIRLENGTLILKGERKFEDNRQKGEGFHRIERGYGSFARSFALPDSVDPEKVRADYKDGVLTITLSKKELAKPRSIKVEVGN